MHRRAFCWLPLFISSIWLGRNWHFKIHKLHKKKSSLFPCRCPAITSQWLRLPSWLTLEMQEMHTIIFSLIVWLWVVIFQPGGTSLTISKTEHNYNGFPWGLVLKASNIWGCWEEVKKVMDQLSFRHCLGSPVSVLWPTTRADLCLLQAVFTVRAENTLHSLHKESRYPKEVWFLVVPVQILSGAVVWRWSYAV